MRPSRDPPVTTIRSSVTASPRARRRCSAIALRSSGCPAESTTMDGSAAASRHAWRHAAGRTAPACPDDGFKEMNFRGCSTFGRKVGASMPLGAPAGRSGCTRVGEPCEASKYPSLMSWSYAVTTLPREIPASRASSRVDGTSSPGCSSPSVIAVLMAVATCAGSGVGRSRETSISIARR